MQISLKRVCMEIFLPNPTPRLPKDKTRDNRVAGTVLSYLSSYCQYQIKWNILNLEKGDGKDQRVI